MIEVEAISVLPAALASSASVPEASPGMIEMVAARSSPAAFADPSAGPSRSDPLAASVAPVAFAERLKQHRWE
jgi:hypothetical protein